MTIVFRMSQSYLKRRLSSYKILLLLALLCAVAQGVWADEWATVYGQTQTTAANWTALTGSTTGLTLGSAGNTTYYYATGNLTFTNSTGGSGLTIQGTVYLYVPEGITVNCTGANASGRPGAGAGIELSEGNTLYLIGGGTINATGGNAANGGNGGNGGSASGSYSKEEVYPGNGGAGGYGGGGAGAGIGTRGGYGGLGGGGGVTGTVAYPKDENGDPGSKGSAGATAIAMGKIYVYQATGITVNATGGSKATVNGHGGSAGGHFLLDFASNQSAAGGAGGGGGGYGGAASDIGTGGPGGGGGGGGSGGSVRYKNNPGYYRVGSTGGGTGMDADGSWHTDDYGASTEMTGTQHFNDDDFSDHGYESFNGSNGIPAYAAGAACGSASISGSTSTVAVEWTTQENDWGMICLQTGTTRANWVHLTDNSSTGMTLGTANTTTYYYIAVDRTFTNSNAGGSGLTIQGTVYLYIPSGKTITCTGKNASGATGGGAGIELTAGNKLYLIGSGTLNATGGNAANGGNGGDGRYALYDKGYWVRSGAGGKGGDGGGGAGAGIGTRGGNGGVGGAGGEEKEIQEDSNDEKAAGNVGSNGANGSTAAEMGKLYIYDGSQVLTPHMVIQGGSGGTTAGNGGEAGLNILYNRGHTINSWTSGGGGGGGGGGFGGAASNIGTGGPAEAAVAVVPQVLLQATIILLVISIK